MMSPTYTRPACAGRGGKHAPGIFTEINILLMNQLRQQTKARFTA